MRKYVSAAFRKPVLLLLIVWKIVAIDSVRGHEYKELQK